MCCVVLWPGIVSLVETTAANADVAALAVARDAGVGVMTKAAGSACAAHKTQALPVLTSALLRVLVVPSRHRAADHRAHAAASPLLAFVQCSEALMLPVLFAQLPRVLAEAGLEGSAHVERLWNFIRPLLIRSVVSDNNAARGSRGNACQTAVLRAIDLASGSGTTVEAAAANLLYPLLLQLALLLPLAPPLSSATAAAGDDGSAWGSVSSVSTLLDALEMAPSSRLFTHCHRLLVAYAVSRLEELQGAYFARRVLWLSSWRADRAWVSPQSRMRPPSRPCSCWSG